MEKYLLRGGNRLRGTVEVSGAKNSALKLLAASILSDEKIILRNVPKIRDVFTMAQVLRFLGLEADLSQKDLAVIKPASSLKYEAPYELVNQMRASVIVLGPLLAKLGRARVAMPGGCNIGSRKIDLHIRGLERLGASINLGQGYIEARAKTLKGTRIALDFPSVGATENLVMAATLAEGTSHIENVAREPEIVDLVNFLNQRGAKIEGAGTSRIRVEGVKGLRGGAYEVVPDRIEAGTFLIAGAITKGNVYVKGARSDHLGLVVNKLREAGAHLYESATGIRISVPERIKAVDVATLPYPGFPTDLQAPMMALLSLARGVSIITENLFESRFMVADELNRVGAKIQIKNHHAVIRGVETLSGAPIEAPDLRAGAALILAGLAADGVTEIINIAHLDRGYENFEQKLRNLGADISRAPLKEGVERHLTLA